MLAQIHASIAVAAADAVPIAARDYPRREEKHPRRALVVDDEPLVRWAVAETLRAAGYSVEEAVDADGTVRALVERTTEPAVVLLDMRLPDCRDLSLLETVRLLAPAAAIILMTSYGTPEIREHASSLGAACVLDKPFDVESLDRLISELPTR